MKTEPIPNFRPSIGDRVTVGIGDSIWTVTAVSHKGDSVNLHLPGTNLERFRVQTSDLKLIESIQQPLKKESPARRGVDAEAIHERLVKARHENEEQLSASIGSLKAYIDRAGGPAKAKAALDKLSEQNDESWDKIIKEIVGILNS